jgi:hypothetical protein
MKRVYVCTDDIKAGTGETQHSIETFQPKSMDNDDDVCVVSTLLCFTHNFPIYSLEVVQASYIVLVYII